MQKHSKIRNVHFLAPAGQPGMMHENFMHWHLCMFVVRCSCMKLYTENYSLGESFNRSFCR